MNTRARLVAWSLLVAVLISCSWAVSSSQDLVFWYVDPFDSSNTIKVDLVRARVVTGDLAMALDLCPADSEYFCIQSRALSFAVPRSRLEGRASWEVKGKRYENKGKGHLRFAGTEIEIFNITSVEGGVLVHFLYSSKSGLLAFGGFEESDLRGRTYLLQQARGLAASPP